MENVSKKTSGKSILSSDGKPLYKVISKSKPNQTTNIKYAKDYKIYLIFQMRYTKYNIK